MKSKTPRKNPTHRLRFQTKDGSLVTNRVIDSDFWPTYKNDKEFREYSFKIEARTKGVKIISWSFEGDDLVAIVEWLSAK